MKNKNLIFEPKTENQTYKKKKKNQFKSQLVQNGLKWTWETKLDQMDWSKLNGLRCYTYVA